MFITLNWTELHLGSNLANFAFIHPSCVLTMILVNFGPSSFEHFLTTRKRRRKETDSCAGRYCQKVKLGYSFCCCFILFYDCHLVLCRAFFLGSIHTNTSKLAMQMIWIQFNSKSLEYLKWEKLGEKKFDKWITLYHFSWTTTTTTADRPHLGKVYSLRDIKSKAT